MSFHIEYDNQPRKFFKNKDKKLIKRIMSKIDNLSLNPVPSNSKRIINHSEVIFRIRIGIYRVLYRINHKSNKIIIIKVEKRSKAYQ